MSSPQCNLDRQRNKMYSAQLRTNSSELTLWHNKLGHPNSTTLAKLLKLITGHTLGSTQHFCDACHQGKIHQIPHSSTSIKTTTVFQLVHFDIWGPAFQPTTQGYKYYISFADDFTWIFPLTLKY